MSQVLAVFGATGQQGGSVVNFVYDDPELSSKYKIRAITRDMNSDKAKALNSRAEVIEADFADLASVGKALEGVHAVFLMNAPYSGDNAFDDELQALKKIADIAVEQGVEFLIYSSLPSAVKISNGKYKAITAFDAKAEVEAYIRTLPIRSAFYRPASFMENLFPSVFLAPMKAEDGTWVITRPHPPTVRYALIAAATDTGKFVGGMLAAPLEEMSGRTISAAQGQYSLNDITSSLEKATGKKFAYKQMPTEEFRASIPFERT
ncbi:NAD(P)-binding protein [Sarocladium strictum]